MSAFDNQYIKYLPYNKEDTNKKTNEYAVVEFNKAHNIYSICTHIKDVIKTAAGLFANGDLSACVVFMEGVSYGSVGSAALVDLAGLNFAIRSMLIDLNVKFTIVSPSQNKKFATGNGAADKQLMIFSWLKIEKHLAEITEIKTDDLADAYFLSNFYKAHPY